MKILSKIMTQNPCYKEGKRQKTKGLMLHSVGCAQPSAEVFYNNWNKPSYNRACVHAFIDANTGDVWQTLPWANYGWHGGTKEANSYYIGVEMCESSYIKYTGGTSFTVTNKAKAQADCKRAYKTAVELFAKLCKDFGLDPSCIVSHNEGRIKGIASAHYDPEHYWKGLGMPYTMDGFRADVKAAMKGEEEEKKPEEKKATDPLAKYTDEQLARMVIRGDFGNGQTRKKALGERYDAVQKIVTRIMKGESAVYYYVRNGDTLSKIARQYGTTVKALETLNKFKNPNIIYKGQRIRIR